MPQKEAAEMNGDALLFFDGKPEELALYEALEARIFSEIARPAASSPARLIL